MTDPDEALRLILERASVLGPETAALAEAVDRVLASDLRAREALPPFDNSAMDGYAVRAADLKDASRRAPAELEVREVVRAGAAGELELEPGEAARIMTGAPLPRGADSVVMVELTSPGAPGRVRFAQPAAPGKHVRARGEDVSAGSLLLEKGALLRPYEVALLAAQGITEVPVVRRPVAAVLATGDELLPASQGLSRGKIRDSNGPAVRAALSRWGVPTRDLGIVADEPGALRAALEAAFASADAVLARVASIVGARLEGGGGGVNRVGPDLTDFKPELPLFGTPQGAPVTPVAPETPG